MVEQICPYCDAGNPLENRFCGQCGARLDEGVPEPHARSNVTFGSGRLLPSASLQQVGRAVAVSLVTLAAEAGLSYLRRRLNTLDPGRPLRSKEQSRGKADAHTADAQTADAQTAGAQTFAEVQSLVGPVTTIISQRVVRIWRNGRLTDQGVEQRLWQRLWQQKE